MTVQALWCITPLDGGTLMWTSAAATKVAPPTVLVRALLLRLLVWQLSFVLIV